MIYPTARAVFFIAVGAPIAAVLAALVPGLWAIGIAWAAMLLLLLVVDGLIAAKAGNIQLVAPKTAEIGAPLELGVQADFVGLMAPPSRQREFGCRRPAVR